MLLSWSSKCHSVAAKARCVCLSLRMCSSSEFFLLTTPWAIFPPKSKVSVALSMRLVLISRLELIIVSLVPACRYNHWPLLWKFGQLPNQGEAHQSTTPAEYRVSHSRHRHQVWFPSKTHHSPPMDRTQLGIIVVVAPRKTFRPPLPSRQRTTEELYVCLCHTVAKTQKCLGSILSQMSFNKNDEFL